jgi:hypothetical protein
MAPQTKPSAETSPPANFGGHRWPTIGSCLATAMEVVQRTNSEIAFASGVTDIGLDDDLFRLQSRQVVLE